MLRLVYRVGYHVLVVYNRVARPRGHGVKCILSDAAGRVLWVRHAYGRRELWELPGGGRRRTETAQDAARREAREELGIDVAAWREVGAITGRWHGGHLGLVCLAAPWPPDQRLDPDPVEIGAVGWFDAGRPPSPVGPVSRAAVPMLASL